MIITPGGTLLGAGQKGVDSGSLGGSGPPEIKEVVGGIGTSLPLPAETRPRLLGQDYEGRSSGGARAELEPLSRPGLGGLPGEGVAVQGVPESGVSVLREEGVPERGALRGLAGPSSTRPTRSANLSEHTVSPRSSGRVETCGERRWWAGPGGRRLACKRPSRGPRPPGPTCSSSTAVAPGPSAGCSRRVSCESRKGTCGRRARSAAITPPSASSERLMVRASRRR